MELAENATVSENAPSAVSRRARRVERSFAVYLSYLITS